MNRVVIRVAAVPKRDGTNDEQIYFSLEDSGLAIQNAQALQPFDCDRNLLLSRFTEEPPSGDNVREVGQTLLERLGGHPAVRSAVDAALMMPERCPLYVQLAGSETAGEFPWETLFDPERRMFLALEGWPIARIAQQVPRQVDLRTFVPPLRLMLVMSALGVSADPEWAAVRQALAGRAVMTLQLDVWVGERELARQVEQDLQELQLSGEVHMLKDGFDLLADVKRFDPHVLHLFCHGTGGDSPLLRLATRRDHLTGSGSSILVEPLQLRDHIGSTWLVTLNCCDSGSDADGARSIANLLVTLGYPAILGMREPVSTKNASLIAHSLYKSLLDYIEVNVVPGREATLEIADVLVGTRRELRDQFTVGTPAEKAARHRDWTLPVLYVRPDPLRVKCVTAAPQHDASTRRSSTNYLDTLMRYRLQAPPDTPANVLQQLDDEIARALRALEGDDVGGDGEDGG